MSSRPWPSSRISRSSSQGQIGPFARPMPALPPQNDAVLKTPRFSAEPSRSSQTYTASFHGHRGRNCNFLAPDNKRQESTTGQPRRNDIVFEINSEIESSKTTSNNEIDESFGGFLQHCALCHKKFEKKDLYMYGFLGAFCSPECRLEKIILDGLFDKKFPSEFVKKLIKIPPSKNIMPHRRSHSDDSDSSSDSD